MHRDMSKLRWRTASYGTRVAQNMSVVRLRNEQTAILHGRRRLATTAQPHSTSQHTPYVGMMGVMGMGNRSIEKRSKPCTILYVSQASNQATYDMHISTRYNTSSSEGTTIFFTFSSQQSRVDTAAVRRNAFESSTTATTAPRHSSRPVTVSMAGCIAKVETMCTFKISGMLSFKKKANLQVV